MTIQSKTVYLCKKPYTMHKKYKARKRNGYSSLYAGPPRYVSFKKIKSKSFTLLLNQLMTAAAVIILKF